MKTLIDKRNREFVVYMGDGEFGTCSTPKILPDSYSIERFIKYVSDYELVEIDMTNYELKNVKIIILD